MHLLSHLLRTIEPFISDLKNKFEGKKIKQNIFFIFFYFLQMVLLLQLTAN